MLNAIIGLDCSPARQQGDMLIRPFPITAGGFRPGL